MGTENNKTLNTVMRVDTSYTMYVSTNNMYIWLLRTKLSLFSFVINKQLLICVIAMRYDIIASGYGVNLRPVIVTNDIYIRRTFASMMCLTMSNWI